ncbi:MAG: hypothetical protein O3A14_08275, partial [Cyanobacteria bacterium]|nr:hypothetical protein [Cyanobacteriota bacterium]
MADRDDFRTIIWGRSQPLIAASLRGLIAAALCGGLLFAGFQTTALASPLTPLKVNTAADAGEGSLRWSITQANADPDADVIDLGGIQGEIILQSPLPPITQSLTLRGQGTTISGNDQHRVLQINGGAVTLQDLTLAHGRVLGGDGQNGGGGSAGMGGGLLVDRGAVRLSRVQFVENQAVGGQGSLRSPAQVSIQSQRVRLKGNRGAVVGVDGVNLTDIHSVNLAHADPTDPAPWESPRLTVEINRTREKIKANRGAIAGVSGVGVNGIGTIAFGGGGGFGGFGNAGNGGNGGNGGVNSGHGGDGGDGGNGGVGIFGSFARWEDQ